MNERSGDWAEGNLFSAHNWWHKSLFNTDIGNYAAAFEIYDKAIFNQEFAEDRPRPARCIVIAVAPSSSAGSADRFAELADAWDALASDPFNDVHAIMAYVGSGRIADARAVVSRLEQYVAAAIEARTITTTRFASVSRSRERSLLSAKVATTRPSIFFTTSAKTRSNSAAQKPSATQSIGRCLRRRSEAAARTRPQRSRRNASTSLIRTIRTTGPKWPKHFAVASS